MRVVITILILFGVGFFLVSKFNQNFINSARNFFSYSPCETPIEYRIGTVDKRFGLTEAEFEKKVERAVRIWNQAAGRTLFSHNFKGPLSVNLVFDERQSLAYEITKESEEIESQKSKLEPEIEAYNQKVAEFRNKLAAFRAKVNFWNTQGGAPFEEFQKLIAEQNQLKQEAAEINQQSAKLNISTEDINLQISQLNNTITNFYQTLAEKPEEGIYKQAENRIEIYFNISENELVHTIAHELGHARGLQHVANPKALMYGKTNKQLQLTPDDLAELERVCQKLGVLESIRYNFLNFAADFTIQQ